VARIAVLGGRTVADLARNLIVVAVMTGVGFAAGFRSPHGAGGLLAALGLVVVRIRDLPGPRLPRPAGQRPRGGPGGRGTRGVLARLHLRRLRAGRCHAGWLQAFGTHQPVNALVNAERALILGGPAAHDVLISLAWSGGLLVVFALLAARTYARMGR
jgi:ABC-2 type transport system permease protein